MRLLTPADEPSAAELLTQALAYLTLWRGPLAQALEPVGEVASLDNVITALALALVDTTDATTTADQRKLAESVLEQEEPEDSSYHGWLKAQGYIPATDQEEPTDPANPADGLFYTLAQVNAHAAAAMADVDAIFPVGEE